MRNGVCPRCAGREIHAARNGLGQGSVDGLRVPVRPHLEPGFRGIVVPHLTNDLWHYACLSCGLIETYLLDPAALDYVRRSWLRIPPPA